MAEAQANLMVKDATPKKVMALASRKYSRDDKIKKDEEELEQLIAENKGEVKEEAQEQEPDHHDQGAGHCCSEGLVQWAGRCGLRRRAPVPGLTEPSLHDLDAATGGEPSLQVGSEEDHERGAAPLRERVDHLHAYRLNQPLERSAASSPQLHRLRVWKRIRAGQSQALQDKEQRSTGGPRGYPASRSELQEHCRLPPGV